MTIELRESRGRLKIQRKGCTVKLLGWFAEDAPPDAFPQDTCGQPGASGHWSPYAGLCCPCTFNPVHA